MTHFKQVSDDLGLNFDSQGENLFLFSILQMGHALTLTRAALAVAEEEEPVVAPHNQKYRATVDDLRPILGPNAMLKVEQMLNSKLNREAR